ncbi:MAG TPA: hypothetical protein PK478_06255 [Nitrospira sp.]|nr:hypothetical protein [Nitrospira sp.]
MKYTASSRFWIAYHALPEDIRSLADKNFHLLKSNPRHPSLHLKRIGTLWSARVGDHYRVLGVDIPDGINWFWIGTHGEYDKLIGA